MARRHTATIEDQADRIVRQLGGRWTGDFAMCRCPAHADGKASLSIRVGDRAVLFHCFAGCTAEAIMTALRSGKILAPPDHEIIMDLRLIVVDSTKYSDFDMSLISINL